jgi:lipid-A-disaccharide synthase-like uncharacterized protein
MLHAIGAYLTDVFVARLDWWVLLGLVAQALFATRFLVQWIASERAGRSVIPLAFWLFSIGGSLLLLTYALYRKDIVFIAGQSFGVFVYLRNLQFVLRDRKAATSAAVSASVTLGRQAAQQGWGAGRAFGYTQDATLTVWSLTLPQVAATLAATLVAHDTLGAGGQRLLDNHVLNAVLVLMLTTSILGPVLTERFAPRLVAASPDMSAH